MAQLFDLAAQTDWSDLAEGEVRVIPLVQYENGVRVRILVSRRGVWPKHVEENPELYVVLKGEVIHVQTMNSASRLARRFFSILESRMEPVSKTAPSRSMSISRNRTRANVLDGNGHQGRWPAEQPTGADGPQHRSPPVRRPAPVGRRSA